MVRAVFALALLIPASASAQVMPGYPWELYQSFNYKAPTNGGSTLLTGLVAYWKLEEASGATRNDVLGVSNLTDVNTVTQVAGKILNAAHFVAASSQVLSAADNANLAFTSAMSISFWVNQTDLAQDRAFVGKWTYQTDGEWVIQSGSPSVPAADAGDMSIFLATSAADDGTGCRMNFTDADMTAGSWFHVVVVFDGSLTGNANRLKLWVNGAAKTLSTGNGAVPATLRNGTATFFLGRFGGSLTRYYNGDIDEVGMWSRAITSAEVATLYNAGAGRTYPFN